MAKKTPAEILAALDADPNVPALARALELETEAYKKLVLHFAAGGDAQLFVVKDEDLRKMGHVPPDARQVRGYLTEAVATRLAYQGTRFMPPASKKVSLDGPSPAANEQPGDPKLKQELEAQLRHQRRGKT
jgi:hypothetical protein